MVNTQMLNMGREMRFNTYFIDLFAVKESRFIMKKGALDAPFFITILLNVSTHPQKIKGQIKNILQDRNNATIFHLLVPLYIWYFSSRGSTLINYLICFILLFWCIYDYLHCNNITINQIMLVLIIVVLRLIPYSQKLEFLGIKFIRFNKPPQKNTKNEK